MKHTLKLLASLSLGVLSVSAFAVGTGSQITLPQKTITLSETKSKPSVNSEQTGLNTEMAKLSYTLGVELGNNLKNQGVKLDADILAAGMKDALSNKPLRLTTEEMQATVTSFQKQLISQKETDVNKIAQQNLEQGQKFLENNAKQSGVKTLPSGLQYKVVKQGSGASPSQNDTVTVNYEGHFIDGMVFDSSYSRGQPATFAVSQVIPGWQEALKMMQPGAVWEVYVPSKLAYGEQGMGNVVAPNETLIFKIELLSVKK